MALLPTHVKHDSGSIQDNKQLNLAFSRGYSKGHSEAEGRAKELQEQIDALLHKNSRERKATVKAAVSEEVTVTVKAAVAGEVATVRAAVAAEVTATVKASKPEAGSTKQLKFATATTNPVRSGARDTTQPGERVKLINVGLVSSGTTSFDTVARSVLGLRSIHVLKQWQRPAIQLHGMGLLNEGNLSLVCVHGPPCSRLAAELHSHDVFSDIPFMAPSIISQAASLPRDRFSFVSTNRSRASWVKSMLKNPSKGGVALRTFYGLPTCSENGGCISAINGNSRWLHLDAITSEQWGGVYDHHQVLLRKFHIPTLTLEDSTEAKWRVLCAALSGHTTRNCEQHLLNGTAWAQARVTKS